MARPERHEPVRQGYLDVLSARLGGPIVNAGIPGNTTEDGLRRLDRDVLALEPRVVFVYLGYRLWGLGNEFDAMGAFSGTLGGFSCVNGSCSGTNADLSGLNVTSGRVFGDVVVDFVGGSANTTSFIGFDGGAQYSGMAYTSAVDAVIDGTVDFALQSNEGTVTVSAVPEAASGGLLLAAALAAAFLFPRSR